MRQIEKAMVDFLDARLKSNGLAQQAIKTKDARLLMTEAAKVCVGIREKTGNNDGPMVELIQETIGTHENESWCMAFVQSMIGYAEVKTGKKSPLYASEGCLDVWSQTPIEQRVKFNPLPGAIVVWQRQNKWNGHTGIVLACDEKIFQAVEGNTTAGKKDGKVVSEGGGVYYTERKRSGNGDMIVLGFLKPF